MEKSLDPVEEENVAPLQQPEATICEHLLYYANFALSCTLLTLALSRGAPEDVFFNNTTTIDPLDLPRDPAAGYFTLVFIGAAVILVVDFAEVIALSAERSLPGGYKQKVVLSFRSCGMPIFHSKDRCCCIRQGQLPDRYERIHNDAEETLVTMVCCELFFLILWTFFTLLLYFAILETIFVDIILTSIECGVCAYKLRLSSHVFHRMRVRYGWCLFPIILCRGTAIILSLLATMFFTVLEQLYILFKICSSGKLYPDRPGDKSETVKAVADVIVSSM